MNYFFGIQSSYVNSKISIPSFQNSGHIKKNYSIFQLEASNQSWKLEKYADIGISKDFIEIDNSNADNEKIFFLANENEVGKFKQNGFKKLIDLNSFTNTLPSYRANLEVSIADGGFSSYQSEYPFSMTTKKGSILSPLISLLNKSADKNIIFLKNIYELPAKEEFSVFFVNFKTKQILKKFPVFTNLLNEIIVESEFISPEVFLYTDKFLGIPIFCSIKNKHISFEHTHPPHEYILSGDKFKTVSKLKQSFHEIIN